MSDDMFENEGEGGAGEPVQAAKKVGFLPAIVIQILKWVALALGAIIFIVTVVIITIQIMGVGKQSVTQLPTSKEYEGKEPIYDWYTNIGEIRARTADDAPHTIIVDVRVGYRQGDKAMQAELIARTPQLRDIIRRFFTSKRAEELKPVNEEKLKIELRDQLNAIMTSNKIQRVIFDTFTVIEF
ncbi:MAG: flagellar basal body-associated FliL family protein [Spirochaetales bacterium]